tara:strand:+ start:451 stop:732 length:282 start_codon:yes stop_codon:yes gene_type:complete
MDKITEQINRMVEETQRHAQDLLADVKDPHVMLHAVYGHISREIVNTVRDMEIPLDLQTKIMWSLILVLEREVTKHEISIVMDGDKQMESVMH